MTPASTSIADQTGCKNLHIIPSRDNSCLFARYDPFSTVAATFSPIMMVGKLVLAQGTLGMIEASATRRPTTP
jgi:hypothetical protein